MALLFAKFPSLTTRSKLPNGKVEGDKTVTAIKKYNIQAGWYTSKCYIAPVQPDEAGVVSPCGFSQGFAEHEMGSKKGTSFK